MVQLKRQTLPNASQAPYNASQSKVRGIVVERYDEVLVALRRLIRATDLHSKYLSKTSGLTSPQLLIMQTIRDQGEVTVGVIAKQVSLSQATVTSILDRLEKRGFVVRERSKEDKRKVNVSLTDDGLDKIKLAPAPLQEHFVKQFQDLQDWEQSMILASLQRIAQMMDAEHIDASPVLDIGDIDRQYELVSQLRSDYDKGEKNR